MNLNHETKLRRCAISILSVLILTGIAWGCAGPNQDDDISLTIAALAASGPTSGVLSGRVDSQSGPLILVAPRLSGSARVPNASWHRANVHSLLSTAFYPQLNAVVGPTVYPGEKIVYNAVVDHYSSSTWADDGKGTTYFYEVKDAKLDSMKVDAEFDFIFEPNPSHFSVGDKLGVSTQAAIYQCPYKVVSDLANVNLYISATVEVSEILSRFPPITSPSHTWTSTIFIGFMGYPLNCSWLDIPPEENQSGKNSNSGD